MLINIAEYYAIISSWRIQKCSKRIYIDILQFLRIVLNCAQEIHKKNWKKNVSNKAPTRYNLLPKSNACQDHPSFLLCDKVFCTGKGKKRTHIIVEKKNIFFASYKEICSLVVHRKKTLYAWSLFFSYMTDILHENNLLFLCLQIKYVWNKANDEYYKI